MPRKSTRGASGSSPEKPATTRRTTRRGQKHSDDAESEVVDEIPAHLLRASDESSEHSDNDSDYGSPKKGRGRGGGRGRGRKQKEVIEEKPTPSRTRRGRRAVRDKTPETTNDEEQHSQDNIESANSQTTFDEHETSTMESEHTAESEDVIVPQEIHKVEIPVLQTEPIPSSPKIEELHEEIIEDHQKHHSEKVSEVTIEQDLSNSDQATVNKKEEINDGENDDGREEINDNKESELKDTRPIDDDDDDNNEKTKNDEKENEKESSVIEKESSPVDNAEDEMSKEAPELPIDDQDESDSRSRSHSSEREKSNARDNRSSSGEIHDDSNDKMEVDTSLVILNKKRESTIDTQKSVEEEKSKLVNDSFKPTASAPLQRKRKWAAHKPDDEPVIAITTDSLKHVIAEEVKPVPLSDVKLVMSLSPDRLSPVEKRARTRATSEDRDAKKKLLKERLRKQEEEEDRRNEQIAKTIERQNPNSPTLIVTNGTNKERKVTLVNEDGGGLSSATTPSKTQSATRFLCITNLVRPLTMMAVKSLLARTGHIEDFWIDGIKSKCFVKYSTEDEAFETRHALHGVKWPDHNLKTLNVEFSTEEEMIKIIESTMGDRIQTSSDQSKESKPEKSFGWSKQESIDERSKSSRRVREWDVGKKEDIDRDDSRDNRRRRRSSERENRREKERKLEEPNDKRRSRSRSPSESSVHDEDKAENVSTQQPGRLLDDLFRKTKTVPCIYWLPLSDEQIKEKEEQRQRNLAEHNRRMEEMLKQQKERREAREQRIREREKEREERREKDKDRKRSRSRSNSRNRRRKSNSRGGVRRRSFSRDRNRRYDRR